MFGSRAISRALLACALAGAAIAANAQIFFSSVSITGSLSNGATWSAGPTFIDFMFPNARVGDGEPTRSGNITVLYNANSQAPIFADDILVSVLGALSGTGHIFFQEVIEDLSDPQNPVIIGSHNALLTHNNQLP
jgi:hypothetical protein